MRTPLLAALAVALAAAPGRAADTPVTGKVVAADLFKNGLAVVRYEVTLGKPGVYTLDDVPAPVHGTYRVEADGPVETVTQMRAVDVPAAEAVPGDLQTDLAGKSVTLHFRDAKRPPLTATVLKLVPEKVAVPDEDNRYGGYRPAPEHSRFLALQVGKSRVYLDANEISSFEVADAADTVRRLRPRLRLTLGATDKPETKVTVRYLARGLAWAASYQIDTTDPKTLTLEQHAVVRNELADLAGAEVRLISGYPSVEFAHVRSPLSPRVSWAAFFQQLNAGPQRDADAMSQNVTYNRVAVASVQLGPVPAGEGVDLHYQPIGKRDLGVGDTLALTVAKGKANYERVVEWLIPDARDESGQYQARSGRPGDEDDAWDALLFKNPLPFPMTTGPAAVTAGGKFNGQRTSHYVSAGEETCLRVGKALSVRTRAVETEARPKDQGDRELVWVLGRHYRRTTVAGEVSVNNHRAEPTRVVIRRRFSGELVRAEGDPKSALREEGVHSANRRNELTWSVPLKAGEERTLKYSYTVLVPN